MRNDKFEIHLIIFLLHVSTVVNAQESKDSLFTLFERNGMVAQSGDCYDDYLVTVSKLEKNFGLYNLKRKKLCNVYQWEPKMDMVGKSDVYHANNSSFGTQRYESDFFPLLYVSNRCGIDNRGILDVFRLVPIKSEDAEDYDSLDVQQVQTIFFPVATDQNALGSPWTVIDREEKCMYTYSRNNRKKAPNRSICRISKFRIPSVGEGNIIYLNDEDILDSYEVDFKAPLSQGACIHLGKMYIAQGVSPEKFLWLRVIDLKQRKLIKSYNLKEAGFKREPEGCFVWRDCLMLTTSRKYIFKMNIPINE